MKAGAAFTIAAFIGAAMAEIFGCFAFWSWLRDGRSWLWTLPGIATLTVFAYLLTRAETNAAGRAYASYGGVYVVVSLAWLRFAEGIVPDRWDFAGALLCCSGAALIVCAPHSQA